MTNEQTRLEEDRDGRAAWKKWGPYLSERQWGTVREDYSENGDAWDYFTHDQARSRAYHWGEDGLAGLSDDKQQLCFALALWNGQDPILKERAFGLTNSEGNHGEDVKEYYFYLDSTPTHSYMKYLYKYPQKAYPYDELVQTNRSRSRQDLEYELLDTGIFSENRYFDVFVEYAKASPEDVLIVITAWNRGPQPAPLHLLPTLWFRNTWFWDKDAVTPLLKAGSSSKEISVINAAHPKLGEFYLYCDESPRLLFTENETNNERVFKGINHSPYVKDAFHEYIIHERQEAVNPARKGTKAAAHYTMTVPPGEKRVVRLRLTLTSPKDFAHGESHGEPFGWHFDEMVTQRHHEADEFYQSITPPVGDDAAQVMRQALAGMFWTKQYYFYDADRWLWEHGDHQLAHLYHKPLRNKDWFHMLSGNIISMPDKWEYPWFAAWDLCFHAVAFSAADIDFSKRQLQLILKEDFLHPNGQIPAYEWNFSDVNPPVHAWATLFVYFVEKSTNGGGDIEFLKTSFNKLLLNFTWWVNRKDRYGSNIFEGGFLGLDNIGVFDRSAPLPTGGFLEQADGTAWMAFFCQNMLEMAVELAVHDHTYEDLAIKFAEHFFWIARAMNVQGQMGLWDEEDGFYYDLLRFPDGGATRLKVRSVVGLLPLCACTVVEREQREKVPRVVEHINKLRERMPDLGNSIHSTGAGHFGVADRGILALVNKERLRRILSRMLDENEFLSPYGIRGLSRYHAEHPYVFRTQGNDFAVNYLPAESDSGMFGGNSNWRGPIWFPINALLIRGLLHYYLYYGDSFKIECPTGSGKMMNLFQVADEISSRLRSIFLRDKNGRRPAYGGTQMFQNDPNWRDCLLFHEYFHGDNGAGLGATHQTGWTGMIAMLIQTSGHWKADSILRTGRHDMYYKGEEVEEKAKL